MNIIRKVSRKPRKFEKLSYLPTHMTEIGNLYIIAEYNEQIVMMKLKIKDNETRLL